MPSSPFARMIRQFAKEGNLFVWTVVILLLIGFAICCWVFSFYVFGHPGKALQLFDPRQAEEARCAKAVRDHRGPQGEFLNAQQLWDRYNKMTKPRA